MKKIIIFILGAILLMNVNSGSAQSNDFPSHITANGEELLLNGTGIRKATIFGIKVYVAALYLEQKSRNDSEIILSDSSKQLQMNFLRELEETKITATWRESLINNNSDANVWLEDLQRLTKGVGDLREGDKLILSLGSKGAKLESSRGFSREVEDPAFARALIRIWLGPNPPDEDLKKGLLGNSG